jgi:peptidylprolyl isomerase
MPIVAVSAVLVVAGCGSGGSSSSTEGTDEKATAEKPGGAAAKPANPDLGRTKPKIKIPNGPPPKHLELQELIKGTGEKAGYGDEATFQYVVVLYKARKQLAASWDRGKPFTMPVGMHEQIAGLEHGVYGMRVGGRRRVTIPPRLAYGAEGSTPNIPPNETLIFVIDMVAVD